MAFGLSVLLMAQVPPVAAGRLEGADAFEHAMTQRERTGKPVALFVYTDWCPYCRIFIRDTLETPVVRRYMQDISEVWLNPEKSRQGEAVAAKYGVAAYPTFFMFSSDSPSPRKVGRMKNPADFVAACKAAAGVSRAPARPAQTTKARTPPQRATSGTQVSTPERSTVTVYLKGGQIVSGRLAGETPEAVLIETGNGQDIYLRDMIERIESQPGTD